MRRRLSSLAAVAVVGATACGLVSGVDSLHKVDCVSSCDAAEDASGVDDSPETQTDEGVEAAGDAAIDVADEDRASVLEDAASDSGFAEGGDGPSDGGPQPDVAGMPESAPDVTAEAAADSGGNGNSDAALDAPVVESGPGPDAPSDATSDSGALATTDQVSTKDAYVRDGTFADTNAGSEQQVAIKQSVTNFTRRTWVTFDIGHFSLITAAKLRLFVNSLDTSATNAVPSNVFSTPTASDSWGELTITWNNAPAIGPQIASLTIDTPSVGTWVEWDVTAAVQADTDGAATFVLEATTGSFRGVFWSSREGANPPVLRITGK